MTGLVKYAALAVFIVALEAIGAALGFSFPVGEWYARLEKPALTPPGIAFAVVWPLLYALIGFAGWRVWCFGSDPVLPWIWALQLAFNFAWTPVFFGSHLIGPALLVLLATLGTALVFALRARRLHPYAAAAFVPYLAWLAFAFYLNAYIWWYNPT